MDSIIDSNTSFKAIESISSFIDSTHKADYWGIGQKSGRKRGRIVFTFPRNFGIINVYGKGCKKTKRRAARTKGDAETSSVVRFFALGAEGLLCAEVRVYV